MVFGKLHPFHLVACNSTQLLAPERHIGGLRNVQYERKKGFRSAYVDGSIGPRYSNAAQTRRPGPIWRTAIRGRKRADASRARPLDPHRARGDKAFIAGRRTSSELGECRTPMTRRRSKPVSGQQGLCWTLIENLGQSRLVAGAINGFGPLGGRACRGRRDGMAPIRIAGGSMPDLGKPRSQAGACLPGPVAGTQRLAAASSEKGPPPLQLILTGPRRFSAQEAYRIRPSSTKSVSAASLDRSRPRRFLKADHGQCRPIAVKFSLEACETKGDGHQSRPRGFCARRQSLLRPSVRQPEDKRGRHLPPFPRKTRAPQFSRNAEIFERRSETGHLPWRRPSPHPQFRPGSASELTSSDGLCIEVVAGPLGQPRPGPAARCSDRPTGNGRTTWGRYADTVGLRSFAAGLNRLRQRSSRATGPLGPLANWEEFGRGGL